MLKKSQAHVFDVHSPLPHVLSKKKHSKSFELDESVSTFSFKLKANFNSFKDERQILKMKKDKCKTAKL